MKALIFVWRKWKEGGRVFYFIWIYFIWIVGCSVDRSKSVIPNLSHFFFFFFSVKIFSHNIGSFFIIYLFYLPVFFPIYTVAYRNCAYFEINMLCTNQNQKKGDFSFSGLLALPPYLYMSIRYDFFSHLCIRVCVFPDFSLLSCFIYCIYNFICISVLY